MKRREFIRVSSAAAAAGAIIPSLAYGGIPDDQKGAMEEFILKGFTDEQEEYPSLVHNEKGEMWMFALRRLPYPRDRELISAFRYLDGAWVETDPVTEHEGSYEAPVAACAPGGAPVVAWCSIDSGQWKIQVSQYSGDHSGPYQFPTEPGRPINPVLHARRRERTWIAWENYHQGKFTIKISKFEQGRWSKTAEIVRGEHSCFDPALAEDQAGNLYVAYGLTDGYHQNIEMTLMDGKTLEVKQIVPVAVGGAFKNRVNLNTKPALAFDSGDRLWISYENNRQATRLDDADCYTGDRCCAMVSYQGGKIMEPAATGKWLFTGKNDHRPSFFRDLQGKLYAASHCGGDFVGNPYWQYRISWLDEPKGWVEPQTILQSKQKGVMIPPALGFDRKNRPWLATLNEEVFKHDTPQGPEQVVTSRVTQLMACQFSLAEARQTRESLRFVDTLVEEHHENEAFVPEISGHPKVSGEQKERNGEVYSLVYGNLHEHSENSPCWSAGTDGTLHEDIRFGLYTEGYDFVGITDHGYSQTELYWRKNLRIADFYNDPPYFVCFPAMEWTLTARGDLESVYGAGHYNVIFASSEEARKFIRNSLEIYNVNTPESSNSKLLWELLHEKQINCITIPHHPADKTHPVDWNVHDPHFVPVVELFQCRGNGEYPGCPREINLQRHSSTTSKRAFVDYALREKHYKMGFVASGDHNGMGVGVAALWIREFSREGLLEAMRSRRCFATTGDKMIVDFSLEDSPPRLNIKVKGQRELEKVEVLRNSRVIKAYAVQGETLEFETEFRDDTRPEEKEVLYYYVRATQKNKEMAWSSPQWVDLG